MRIGFSGEGFPRHKPEIKRSALAFDILILLLRHMLAQPVTVDHAPGHYRFENALSRRKQGFESPSSLSDLTG